MNFLYLKENVLIFLRYLYFNSAVFNWSSRYVSFVCGDQKPFKNGANSEKP